jgi:hypothetical protein
VAGCSSSRFLLPVRVVRSFEASHIEGSDLVGLVVDAAFV